MNPSLKHGYKTMLLYELKSSQILISRTGRCLMNKTAINFFLLLVPVLILKIIGWHLGIDFFLNGITIERRAGHFN